MEVVEVIEAADDLRHGKSLMETSIIQVLEFFFILMFRKKYFWVNHEISFKILAAFLSEAAEASV